MNHRGFHAACSVFVLILLTATLAFSQERLSVSVAVANIRTGPGTDYKRAWQAEKNYPVSIIERKDSWVRFKDYEGDEGWILGALLSPRSTVVVKKTRINVRSGPGTGYAIVFKAEKGVPFEVMKNEGDWLRVKHADGDTGWIFKPLVW